MSTRRSGVATCACACAGVGRRQMAQQAGDVIARVLCDAMSGASGQPFIGQKPGANSSIGANEVPRAALDGYTWMQATGGAGGVVPAACPLAACQSPALNAWRRLRCLARAPAA